VKASSLRGSSLYSSFSHDKKLQMMADKLRKARSANTSNKWSKDTNRPSYTPSNMSNRPILGGHARNNLKSSHNSIPILKPMFAQEVDTGVTKAASAEPTISSETKESKPQNNESDSNENQPKLPLGTARFFFMGRNTQNLDPSQLPSASWTPPVNPARRLPKNEQALGSSSSNGANSIEKGPIVQSATKGNPVTGKVGSRSNLGGGSVQQREPKKADGKDDKRSGSLRNNPAQKHRSSSAPRRPGQRMMNDDIDGENKMKRRRK
ncbi:hypothetical protein LPJ57_010983, partial [Coemansia sp. RSA 486]